MEINFSKCSFNKVIPADNSKYSTFKAYYDDTCSLMKLNSKTVLDKESDKELDKKYKKFLKGLYNLENKKYLELFRVFRPEFIFVVKNLDIINRTLLESNNPGYALSNMCLISNIRRSVVNAVVNNLIKKTNSKVLEEDIKTPRPAEVMMCKREIRLRLLEVIRIDYFRTMQIRKREDSLVCQEMLEKALNTFIEDDVVLDYYHSICDRENLQKSIEKELSKKMGEANKVRMFDEDTPHALRVAKEKTKALKNAKHRS